MAIRAITGYQLARLAEARVKDIITPIMNADAVQKLQARAEEIARSVTAMHPVVPRLENSAAQNEILRALFELTKQVEVVKKQLLIMQKEDESKVL